MTNDLITIKEAALFSNKSIPTIRSWLNKGYLTKHKKDESKKNAPIYINTIELKVYLARHVKPTNYDESDIQSQKTVSIDLLEKQIGELKSELDKIKYERDLAVQKLTHKDELLELKKEYLEDTKKQSIKTETVLKEIIEKNNQVIAKLKQKNEELLRYINTPWWKRIAHNVPLLEG